MATLKNVVIEYHNEVTVNMGNFENQKPGYRVSATLVDGGNKADIIDAKNKLKALVTEWLEDEIKEIREG